MKKKNKEKNILALKKLYVFIKQKKKLVVIPTVRIELRMIPETTL